MECVWSDVLSATINFGPPEHEGVSRIVILKCNKQNSLYTENCHTDVPCCVTEVHGKTFGMKYKTKMDGH